MCDLLLTNIANQSLPLQSLPPFLRALLVTDGTVTKMLEAYFWEPIQVVTVSQEFIMADTAFPAIAVQCGDAVLIRQVQLRGATSDAQYAQAYSVIRTAKIPDHFRQRLIDRELGIGTLIRDSGMESYREVMEIGIAAPAPDAIINDIHAVFRTYRIIIAGQPVILITETFSIERYR
ncbi:DUF98 domain-containing protein [Rhodoferax sp. 4810]|uniref:DUF98 domain-containing protein n=1 Tax=Thiospirillum jenense TaxID=1653858 RepID=A0A839HFF0_9GAMM|nr:chorismate pyruvate-lyase family protein [Thiospirillum jenense]MBB1077090.1 DUF98 domain-containing protein [Rhodoferax jenense]MBB1127174.1 DUF98 domain-containing protein [Thiospirillum jenense]